MKENDKDFLTRIKRLTQHFKRSVIMSWKASPLLFLLRISYELITVVLPILSLYLSKTVINILSAGNYEEHFEYFVFELSEPAPETGDSAAIGLWIAMLTVSSAAIYMVLRRKREQA